VKLNLGSERLYRLPVGPGPPLAMKYGHCRKICLRRKSIVSCVLLSRRDDLLKLLSAASDTDWPHSATAAAAADDDDDDDIEMFSDDVLLSESTKHCVLRPRRSR